MQNLGDARELATSLIRTAAEAGLPTECLLTDMNQVLGETAGNSLEIFETIDYLNGTYQDERLHEVTIALASKMLRAAGVVSDENNAAAMALGALQTGAAREVFARMIDAQGGPSDLLDYPEKYIQSAKVSRAVYPAIEGQIDSMDVRRVGNVIVGLGGGRNSPTDTINPSVGLSKCAGIADHVGVDRPICIVHASSEDDADRAEQALLDCVKISTEAVTNNPTIVEATSP